MKLVAAGNVEVPAYLALKSLGFSISVKHKSETEKIWAAENQHHEFIGNSPLELLALVKLLEVRGSEWQATDSQIDDFVKKFS